MSAVVDLGCHDYGKWASLQTLVGLFHPDRIYGFDPSPQLDTSITEVDGVPATLERRAAWIEDTTLPFRDEEIADARIGVITHDGPLQVDAFDFSAWMVEHGRAAVKMDIEGAEYAVLSKMILDGTHRLLDYLFIEWHDTKHEQIISALECPVVSWWM